MKKVGIVGGLGWRSTVDYYSEICRRSEEWQLAQNPGAFPSVAEIVIESLDLRKAVGLLGFDEDEQSWRQFDEYHRGALQRLQAAGAEFALIASNTCHHRFSEIIRGIGIPVISIIDSAAKQCRRIGAREVLILGTAMTMRSERFRAGFQKFGINATAPPDQKEREMTIALLEELQLGRPEGAAERLGQIVSRSIVHRSGPQPLVCLACTELPLAFPEKKMLASFEHHSIRYISTTAAHINDACELALN